MSCSKPKVLNIAKGALAGALDGPGAGAITGLILTGVGLGSNPIGWCILGGVCIGVIVGGFLYWYNGKKSNSIPKGAEICTFEALNKLPESEQKSVFEHMREIIQMLTDKNVQLIAENTELKEQIKSLKKIVNEQNEKIDELNEKFDKQNEKLDKIFDSMEKQRQRTDDLLSNFMTQVSHLPFNSQRRILQILPFWKTESQTEKQKKKHLEKLNYPIMLYLKILKKKTRR